MMKKHKPNWLERIVTFVSIALVIFVIGVLFFEMITNEGSAPHIIVELGAVEENFHHVALAITAKNIGNKTAKDVYIEVYSSDPNMQEKGKIHFDYIPVKSTVKGVITFAEKPIMSTLKVHILGYEVP